MFFSTMTALRCQSFPLPLLATLTARGAFLAAAARSWNVLIGESARTARMPGEPAPMKKIQSFTPCLVAALTRNVEAVSETPRTVYPSWACDHTCSAAVPPRPPGMLVTIIFWPSDFSMIAASWRFMTSVPPPADEKTTSVIVFVGNAWPSAIAGASSTATVKATTLNRAFFLIALPPSCPMASARTPMPSATAGIGSSDRRSGPGCAPRRAGRWRPGPSARPARPCARACACWRRRHPRGPCA